MINYIINELAQKEYKTRYNWVEKGIRWELCKKFKFGNTKKWYEYNPESVLKNETHLIIRDFIKTNESSNFGQMIRPSDSQQNKKNRIVNFPIPVDHRVKLSESEKRDKYLDLAKELKNYGT